MVASSKNMAAVRKSDPVIATDVKVKEKAKEVKPWTTATHERMIKDKKIITLPGDAPDPPPPPHKSHEQNCMKKENTSSIAQRNLFRGSLRTDRFCVRKLQGYDFN